MTEIPVSRILNALLSKGFERYQSHHTTLWLVIEGKRTSVRARISHGQRRADDWLLGQMAKQLHLSRQELLSIVECEISGDRYVSLMIERGHVRP